MKIEFLKNEIFILSLSGAFQRNNIYKESTSENEKIQLRRLIKSLLVELEDNYKIRVSDSQHLANLDEFKKNIEKGSDNILRGSVISFGTVQKILNLYLKYLWCLGLISEPPHCPIDRIILNKSKDYKTSWTKMNREDYCRAIEKIRLIKENKSIAEWELQIFARR